MRFRPAAADIAGSDSDESAEMPAGSETILLVEDNEGVRSAARRILERQGYRVIAATTGEDALQLYQVHGPEIALVLADVIMPRMSGFDLVAALRRQGLTPRFLLTSGYTERTDEAAELGVPLMPKPWTPGQLARRVRQVIDGGRS
jgi:CheY-like chemotaxis protein